MMVRTESISRATVREMGSVGPWICAHRVSCSPPFTCELTVTAKILGVEKGHQVIWKRIWHKLKTMQEQLFNTIWTIHFLHVISELQYSSINPNNPGFFSQLTWRLSTWNSFMIEDTGDPIQKLPPHKCTMEMYGDKLELDSAAQQSVLECMNSLLLFFTPAPNRTHCTLATYESPCGGHI